MSKVLIEEAGSAIDFGEWGLLHVGGGLRWVDEADVGPFSWFRGVVLLPADWDPNKPARDWRDRVTLEHEEVEQDGFTVPLFAPLDRSRPRGRTVWGWPWGRAYKRKGSR